MSEASTTLTVFYLFLAFLSGVILPVQSSINATLLNPLNSQVGPAAISFLTGTISLMFVYFYDPRKEDKESNAEKESLFALCKTAPLKALLVPGVLGAYFVALGAVLGSKLGFSLFFVCVVTGNLVAAAFVDHIGAFGLEVRKLSIFRSVTMVAVLIGSALTVFEQISFNEDEDSLPLGKNIAFIFLSFFSGCLFPAYIGLSNILELHMKTLPHRITLWSFATSTVYLIIATYLSTLLPSVGKVTISGLKDLDFWKFLGGPLGAFYVFLSVYLGPRIGISFFLVFSIAGQLVGSLVIDNFGLLESTELEVTLARGLGVTLVFVALVCFQFEDQFKYLCSNSNTNESETDSEV